MSLRIVHYNESVLHRKGVKIERFDAALTELAEDMVEAMHEAGGIGLAAQQVGRALQLCVVDLREAESKFTWSLDGSKPPLDLIMPMALVNPHVTVAPATAVTVFEEGCLSFPKIRGDIARPDAITVKFQDQHGIAHVLTCDGLFARCVQHEVDHLNGVLFIERMNKKVRAPLEDAIRALAKETKGAGAPAKRPASGAT
jgi:peptide deformylase